MADEVLRIENLQAWYGESHVLHGVNLTVHKGEVVTLLGRNGAGRTVDAQVGAGPRRQAQRLDQGERHRDRHLAHLQGRAPGHRVLPEERGIFSSLSVEENLMLPPEIAKGGMSVEEIYEMFPNLRERRKTAQGTKLSGGEQQMLAMARILRTGPTCCSWTRSPRAWRR
jgi:branched-chain amino acid transport system ATP-binding protein